MPTLLAILQVALGLGFVIFVHELGHFLVAKACGVRCDKFFVGFDIGGIKLSRKWGETEYGIGVLPLGGYVKMFGQEDNAGAIAEELAAAKALEGSPDAKPVKGPGGETVWVHKRSYLAKSVPQRMAIISAGVIMNVIFAVVMAWVAFGIGVPEEPAVVGGASAGGPAWQAGLRPGDRILKIGDIENPSFVELRGSVVLGDLEKGIDCEIERGDKEKLTLKLRPRIVGQMPQVGISASPRLRLSLKEPTKPHSPAAELGSDGFVKGDQIVEIDGAPVDSYDDLAAAFAAKRAEPVTLTVVRGGEPPDDDPFGVVTGGERVSVTIPADPMERLGIVPKLGAIVAIESGSPAEAAGLKVGDVLVTIDGVAIGSAPEGEAALDPLTLDERLSAREGELITLRIDREGEAVEVPITPRAVRWLSIEGLATPLAIDSLGIACEVPAQAAAVIAGSPAAAAADLRAGDGIQKAVVRYEDPKGKSQEETLEFDGGKASWPIVVALVQNPPPSMEIELTVDRSSPGATYPEGKSPVHTVKLKPATVADAYSAGDRGLVFEPVKRLRVATTFGERTELALSETGRALSQVVKFLQKLGGQVSVTALGGPITIATIAGQAAFEGVGALLMQLVMLSANLAVLNFLPIPVLDGGHMVFLAYEGITGRPVNERVAIALQTVGLFFLLGLMLFVTSMDITRLLSWLR